MAMPHLSRSLLKWAVVAAVIIALLTKFFQNSTLTNSLDGPDIDAHPDYFNTSTILDNNAVSQKSGYVPSSFGVSSPAPSANTFDTTAPQLSSNEANTRVTWQWDTMGREEFEMEPFGSYRQHRFTIASGPRHRVKSLLMKEDGTRSDIRLLDPWCHNTTMSQTTYFNCDWVCTGRFDDPNSDCMEFLNTYTQRGRNGTIVELPNALGRTEYGELQVMFQAKNQGLPPYLHWIPYKTVYTFCVSTINTIHLDISTPKINRGDVTTWRNESHPKHWKRCAPVTCIQDCEYDICANNPGYCLDQDGEDGHQDDSASDADNTELSSRDGFRIFARAETGPKFSSGKVMVIKAQGYYSSGKLLDGKAGAGVLQSWFDYADPKDCDNVAVKQYTGKQTGSSYASEHIIELQTIKGFLMAAEDGTLESGKAMNTAKVDEQYFWDNWNQKSLPSSLPLINGKAVQVPNDRVFIALGSRTNRVNFVLLDQEINTLKGRIWGGIELYAKFDDKLDQWLQGTAKKAEFLKFIKSAQATFSYLEDMAPVKQRLTNIIALVRVELAYIDKYTVQKSGASPALAEIWDEYMPDLLGVICDESTIWVKAKVKSARDKINGTKNKPADYKDVLKTLNVYEKNLPKMTLGGRS